MNAVKPDRIPCEVLGCRRTAPKAKYAEGTVIICYKCWRLGSAGDRHDFTRAERAIAAIEAPGTPLSDEEIERLTNLDRVKRAAWRNIVETAFQAKAGLA